MLGRLVTFQPVTRKWVELETIAPSLYQSVLMSEDGRFCSHNGVDWDAVNLVITDALEGERPRGASTITMQTAKNLFLWGGRSYLRKVLEVPLALWIDLVLSKQRIMEIYLNIAEWDSGGIYGIEAGAQSHFGRSASKLTQRQSALMAVTLPNPILREPSKPNAGLNRLSRIVETRAKQSGAYIKCLK
jgi:monofunctional biosynthetic peptidoglycan transglycosylase